MKPAGVEDRFVALLAARGRKPETLRSYRQALKVLARFLEERGKEDVREVTEEDATAFLAWLRTRGWSQAVVVNRAQVVRAFFRYLCRSRTMLVNPIAGLHIEAAQQRARTWLSESEVECLLAAPDVATRVGLRDRALLELLYATGLRCRELVGLDLEDLDFTAGLLTVRTSKNGEGRSVPLGDVASTWLTRYLKQARPALSRSLRRRQQPRTQRVFLARDGELTDIGMRLLMLRHARHAAIEKRITPHVMRHSFAIHMLRHGASTRHLQAMLGHRSLESTQIYTRVLPEDLRKVVERSHPRGKRSKRKRKRSK